MQDIQVLKTFLRLLALSLLAAALAACHTVPPRPGTTAQVSAVTQLEQAGKYSDAAEMDEKLAASAAVSQRNEFLVGAAEDWQSAGNPARSWAVIREIHEKSLYPALLARMEIVKASLYLAQHDPQMALQRLKFALTPLPPELKAKALLVRGQAHQATGDLVAMVADWTERETYLPVGGSEVAANHELIWNTLTETHTPIDVTKLPAALTPMARGWLELADIERTSWQQPEKFLDQIKQWQSKYPDHPAQQKLVPDLIAKQQALTSFPAKIAVLLPLQGNYQSPSDAVRDGLMAAYYQVGGDNPPSITVYDSGTTAASALAAYQKAVSDGAAMVIGPLTKDSVAGLAAQPSLPVPVLALNYLDNDRGGPGGFYQFGLLPEGESAQVAERAIAEGRTHAVALVSNDDLGARMFNSFQARFSQLGGNLLGMQTYAPKGSDYAPVLTQLFGLDASQEREQRLASTIAMHMEYDPRRRQDIQFVYLVASADDARTLQPQIGYNRGEDLPVYTTSKVFTLDDSVDNTTLNGVIFDDMPWTLEESGSVADMRNALHKAWPNNFANNSRLYALGFDAYRLVPLLYNTHGIAQAVQGVTGMLSMDPNGRVHRRLDWASFEDGSADLLAPVDLPAQAPVTAVQPAPKP
jgi:outer membrane PBP1 activator LpoA protein